MRLREFLVEDAEELSELIRRNLRQVLSQEYDPEAIEALLPLYTPERIREWPSGQYTIVCQDAEGVIGTASLDGNRVRNVFVAVDRHGEGIGRLLMEELEAHAREAQLTRLYLHAGLTAEGFYHQLGYRTVKRAGRKLKGVPIPDIKMEKRLSSRGG